MITSCCSRLGIALISTRLLMDQAALTQRRRKELSHGCEQSLMSIGDQEIDLTYSTRPQVLQQGTPAIFTFLCARPKSQHFSASFKIHAQRG